MITKKKSSLLKTHKNKKKHNNNKNNHNNSSNVSHNSKTIQYKIKKYNDYYNNNDNNNNREYNSKYSIMSINSNFTPSQTKKKRKKYKTFLSKVHTLRRMKRIIPFGEDKLSTILDDYNKELKTGKIIKLDTIDTMNPMDIMNPMDTMANINNLFFNHKLDNCICENIYNTELSKKCKCNTIKLYTSQGKSKASIYSLKCSDKNKKNILKVMPVNTFYMKMRNETKKYIFIELDEFTHHTIINNYVYKLLPNNCINIINSGVCNKSDYKNNKKGSSSVLDSKTGKSISISGNYHSYNLMSEAELGSGRIFLINLLEGKYDDDFNITHEEIRYNAVRSFLLQSILIIAHLQSSSFEFCHGDYKPDNVFVKKCSPKDIKYYKFNAFGNEIKIKNMGFAVLIGDFDKSSITINSTINSNRKRKISIDMRDKMDKSNRTDRTDRSKKKYRLVPHIVSPFFLSSYVNDIITEYGDIDPDTLSDDYDIKINKITMSKFIPVNKDPTISIIRSAGVKLYRDFDIYTFVVRLLNDKIVREYIISKKLDKTVLNFMSSKFQKYLLNTIFNKSYKDKMLSSSETSYLILDIFEKINEPMYKIFTDDYFNLLKNLNYKLFKL